MNKMLLTGLTIMLLFSAGCINIVVPDENADNDTQSNIAPVAYIDSVEPSSASAGEVFTFEGHGTDSDGFVVGYEWQSSIDGVISTVSSFTTTTLSPGTHTITFRVLDDNQKWSQAVSTSVIANAAIAKPVIELFSVIPDSIILGETSTLQWNVSGTETVFIDKGIGEMPANGSIIIYPTASTTFTLTATNTGGSVTATTSISVEQSFAGNPIIEFNAQHLQGNSWQLNWNVLNATEITIEPDIGEVSPSGSAVISVPSGQTVTYRLYAKNDIGGWAYWDVTMAQP